MNLTVHALCQLRKELILWQFTEFINPLVDRCSTMILHPTLIPKDARLHIIEVILLTLLKGRVIAFLLKLLCLQIITWIKLITDGQRYDIQFLQVTSHCHHLQHRLLRTIIRVLGTSLALRNPYILTFLSDSKMDIATHQLTALKHLVSRQSTTNRKGLVHTHQPLNPRIDQQIVANTYLHRSGIAILKQQQIKESRVEHDVTMIADKRVARSLFIHRQQTIIKCTSIRMFADDILHYRLHKPLLEIKGRLHPNKSQTQQAVTKEFGQPGRKSLHDKIKLAVVQ